MIYFVKFFIFYLLIANVCKATEDFDDYDDSVDYVNDDRNSYLSPRQVNSQQKMIPENFVGSNLFGSGRFNKQCFSVEDVALLATRSKFEALIPNLSKLAKTLEDDKSVEVVLEYFYGFNELLNVIEKDDLRFFSQQAFYDAVGGYLNYFYWPLVKHSFYAGMLTYNSTISVYSLHKHCKDAINTMGNGWRQSQDISKANFQIEPINVTTKINQQSELLIPPNGRDNPCEKLLLASDEENTFETDMIVSLPQFDTDDNDDILNVRLPFKRKQNFNFNSKASAFVLLKYYVSVSKCYEYRKQSSERFDMRLLKLVNEKFLPFVRRDIFYPGFGAIFRITESLSHRAVVLRNVDNVPMDVAKQLQNNRTDSNQSDDDLLNGMPDEIFKMQPNETSFFEEVVHFISFDETDESRKIEILFFLLIATVLSFAFVILCCCLIMRRKQKKGATDSQDRQSNENRKSFKSFFHRSKIVKKDIEKDAISESNIGPRSSSILVGNDLDDTESRVSSQTKSSGLSLKDLIHAEISKRPSKPSKQQIKALSRNSKSTS